MYKKTLRPAIAMIELIFAIVIIGIVLMTAPMLIRTSAQSGYVTIQQENINQAASRVSMIMGYPWDEGNVENSTFNTILRTDSPVPDLNETNRTVNITIVEGYRVGTPIESLRNFKAPGNTRVSASSTLGIEAGGIKDDIDDFIGGSTLFFTGETSTSDYVEDNTTISINTLISYSTDTVASGYNQASITYNPFTASGGTTNIKEIKVTLISTSGLDELDKTIILRAFSCNIGGYKLEEKDF